MGCGDACPVYPGKRYEDWELDDPAQDRPRWRAPHPRRDRRPRPPAAGGPHGNAGMTSSRASTLASGARQHCGAGSASRSACSAKQHGQRRERYESPEQRVISDDRRPQRRSHRCQGSGRGRRPMPRHPRSHRRSPTPYRSAITVARARIAMPLPIPRIDHARKHGDGAGHADDQHDAERDEREHARRDHSPLGRRPAITANTKPARDLRRAHQADRERGERGPVAALEQERDRLHDHRERSHRREKEAAPTATRTAAERSTSPVPRGG